MMILFDTVRPPLPQPPLKNPGYASATYALTKANEQWFLQRQSEVNVLTNRLFLTNNTLYADEA